MNKLQTLLEQKDVELRDTKDRLHVTEERLLRFEKMYEKQISQLETKVCKSKACVDADTHF
jgi:hypothetical protein